MKLTFNAALLALLLATPAFALQEPDKDKPPQQEEPKKEEPKKQEPDRQQPQEKEKQQQDKAQADKAKQTDKQQQQADKDRAKQDKTAQEHAQQVQRDEHGNAVQAQRDGGGNGGRTIKEQTSALTLAASTPSASRAAMIAASTMVAIGSSTAIPGPRVGATAMKSTWTKSTANTI